jgi:hypothetical protein
MGAPAPDVHFKYKPQGRVLKEFHRQSGTFVRVLIGPLGSGKTQACISEMLRQIDTQVPDNQHVRRSRWAAVRNTYPDLVNTTIKDFKEIVEPMGIGTFVNTSPPRWNCKYKRPDGTTVEAEVLFLAFDIPQDEKKARGLQLSGVWLNEMKELNRNNTDMLMGRVGRYPPRAQVRKAHSCIIGDTNAPDRDHWLAKLCKEEHPKGWWFGIQPPGVIRHGGDWVTNPDAENVNNLPPNYYARLIAGRKASWIRKNLANEFVYHTDGRPVHPDFNEAIHVADYNLLPTNGIVINVGIDFGRTPAACIMQRQLNNQWYVLDELVSDNTSALSFGKALRAFLNEHYSGFVIEATGDPAGDDMAQTRDETPIEMINLAGVECHPASTNDFETRITALDSQLTAIIQGQPKFLISPKCQTLIKGLAGGYQYRRLQKAGDDSFHNKPEKSPTSHVVEACHYGLMGAGEGDNLFEGAWAQTVDELKEYEIDQRVFE